MKIVIPGGSGQVGTVLARYYHAQGHEVVVLSRTPSEQLWRTVMWDAQTLGDWATEIDGADVVINLAGRSVNCRYTQGNREDIIASRVDSTLVIGQAIATAQKPPTLWLQASTATIYAHTLGQPHSETGGVIGGTEPRLPDTWRFSIDVARAWENALDECAVPHTRKVKLRSAIVMNPDRGSAFDTLLGLVRCGLGGQSGNGKQFVSWIHEEDFIRAVDRIIEHPELEGVINVASPNPLPNAEFMQALRQAWGIPVGLPATTWMLEIGAFFLQTETELILKSRRVVPTRLLDHGFEFRYPSWAQAAQELCLRWRSQA